MNVGTLTISLTARTAALLSSLSKVRTFESGVMASVQRMNRSLGTLGQSLSVLSLPLVAIGGLAVKKFADFEYAMAKITGLAGVSSKQVQAWTKDVLYLSQKTGESAQELGDALYYIASSGIKNASKALEVLELSAYGAMAGLGKAKDIANLLTSVINAYGEANVDTAHTMDVLVAAVREGKAEATDMAKALGLVVNVAAELGISSNNVAAAVAATTRTGVPVSTSVTQLRQLLFSFLKERPMVESALESMGMTFQEVRDSLSEDLLTGLIKLRAVTSAWGDNALAQVLPNVRAFNEALSLTGVNVLETMKLFREVQNPTNAFATAVRSVAETAKVKLNQAMQTLNNSLLVFGASIADDVLPIVQRFTDLLAKLFGWFSSLDSKTQNMIITITALSAVLGPVLLVLSSFVSAIGSLASALFNPLGMLLAVAAASALVADNFELWEKAWPRIMIKIGKFVYTLYLGILKLRDSLLDVVQTIGELLKANLGNFFGSVASTILTPGALAMFDEDSVSKRKWAIAALEAEIAGFEKDLATRPDLQYGFMDALGDSLKNEGSKLLKWAGSFVGDFNAKMGGIKLNIGGDGPTTLDFLDYMDSQVDLAEFQSFVDKVQEVSKKYGGVLAAFGEVPGMTETTNSVELAQLINDEMIKLNKEITNIIANKGDLAEFISTLSQGLKDLMDPKSLEVVNLYIRENAQAIADADAALKSWAENAWIFKSQGKPMMDFFKAMDTALASLSAKTTLNGSSGIMNTLDSQLEYWESIKAAAVTAADTMRYFNKNAEIPETVLNSYKEATANIDAITLKLAAYNAVASSAVSIAESIGAAIGNAISGMESAWTGIVDAILSAASQIIAAMLSVAVAAFLANGATKGLLGLVLAAVGIAAMTAIWTSQKSKMQEAANLKDGGMIPDGYPNDTFKANLTSKELVIPLERVPQLQGIGRSGKKQQVEFIIEGRVLKGILKDADMMGGLK